MNQENERISGLEPQAPAAPAAAKTAPSSVAIPDAMKTRIKRLLLDRPDKAKGMGAYAQAAIELQLKADGY